MLIRRLLATLSPLNSLNSLAKGRKQNIFGKRFFTSTRNDTEIESIRKTLEADNQRKEALTEDQGSTLKTEKRMLIGFTCKVCQQRTHRTMSHHAYHNGIVLIECSGCQSRHLIADNLGWFKDTPNAARKIEEMTSEVGEIKRTLEGLNDEGDGLIELLK